MDRCNHISITGKLVDKRSKSIDLKVYDEVIYKQQDKRESKLPPKQEAGTKPSKKRKLKDEEQFISKRSLIRTRYNLMDTVECNRDKFNTFITLTFKENVEDVNKGYYAFKKYTRTIRDQLKKENKEFYYVAIPEFQKRGAIHFHVLTNLKVGSNLIPKRKMKSVKSNKSGYRRIECYDLPFWKHGLSEAEPIDTKNEEFNPALYMCKYLQKGYNEKDSKRLFQRQKVLKSQNLDKPIVTDIEDSKYITILKQLSKHKLIKMVAVDKEFSYNDHIVPYKLYRYEFDNVDEKNKYLEMWRSIISEDMKEKSLKVIKERRAAR